MLLLILLLLLIAPYLLLALLGRVQPGLKTAPPARARVGLSLFFIFTAMGHFINTAGMAAMLPAFVPNRATVIIVTGILELLAAAGIWIPRLKRITGICIILMLLGFLPANMYAAINHVDFGGHKNGPGYLLVRIPFQLLVIWWAYYATEQQWRSKRAAMNFAK